VIESINLKNIISAVLPDKQIVFFMSADHKTEGFSIKSKGSEMFNAIL